MKNNNESMSDKNKIFILLSLPLNNVRLGLGNGILNSALHFIIIILVSSLYHVFSSPLLLT